MISKIKLLFLFLLSGVSVLGQTVDLTQTAWQFKNQKDANWLPATVPGTVHTDLLKNKKIEDPYYRTNEKDQQWIDKENWEYKTTFTVAEDLLKNDKVAIVFEGLDTYADVFINNTKVITANNMFLSWQAEIKKLLKPGQNQLSILFQSPINKVKPIYDGLGYIVPVSDNDQGKERVSVFTRKAGYHYGWDWGPRFVTSGVWRPVYLKAWSQTIVEDLFIKQRLITEQNASLEAQITVNTTAQDVKKVDLYVDGSKTPVFTRNVLIVKGQSTINLSFNLKDIELWWPNGMGKQRLYHFKAVVTNDDGSVATREVKRGLRNIEVVQEAGEKGESFYVKVNGKAIFMKGANYISQDNFLPNVTKQRYEHIINTAVESNMNMLRVWGGGIYENDLFYDLCDEKGILIWHDFMFACAMYPPLGDLKKSIYDEAVYNIKRLRNHASIALWCGNNENTQFRSRFFRELKSENPADSVALAQTYDHIFHEILPAALKAYDDEKFYWSSSPNGVNYSAPMVSNKTRGDAHYWGVWHSKKPFESFKDNISPFMSEYGFQSFPELETVKTYAIPSDYNIDSEVMKAHQRSGIGNRTISAYMDLYYQKPKSFEDFLYVGQLLQAEGIKEAIESHRRAMPFCMGSVYWQLNDCWPVASWSSMDYYGRWKALQYTAKKSFQPVLVSAMRDKDSVKIFVVSDLHREERYTLQASLLDFSGKIIKTINKPFKIPANTSTQLMALAENEWLKGVDKNAVFLNFSLAKGKGIIAENIIYFNKQKSLALLKPDIIIKKLDQNRIELSTNTLAKNVWLDLPGSINAFSDNYFDLIPGTKKIVKLNFKTDQGFDVKAIKIKSLVDTY